jgi:hypothetical protein
MGVIVRISKHSKAEETRKALDMLNKKNGRKKSKSLADFYGKLQGAYGDGLNYQKKLRNEWQ